MAASFFGCGKTLVAAAGTPIAASIPANVLALNKCHALIIQVLSGNVGRVYVGVASDMVKGTLAKCLIVLPPPTSTQLPSFTLALAQAANAIPIDQLYVDADTSGDGVMISGIVA